VKIYGGVFIRFCPITYETNKSRMDKLRVCLESAAVASGLDVVCRSSCEGAIGKKKECMVLVCSCSLLRTTKVAKKSGSDHCDDDAENKENRKDNNTESIIGNNACGNIKRTLLHNARKANRKGGKAASRRTDTKARTDSAEPRCPFRLPVHSDKQGFYVKGGNGCGQHCYHSRRDPELPLASSTRLLLPEDRQYILDADKAHAGNTTNRNLFYVRGGKFLTVDQCRHICGSASDSKGTKDDAEYDVTRAFKDFFEEKKANCFFLYHKSSGLLSEQHDGTTAQVTMTELGADSFNLSRDEVKRTETYALASRCGQGLQASQDVMLALAWVLPFEKRQFSLFPFIIHLDSTNATNAENRPLFTITGRDSQGKQYTVLRALVPSECSWIFKWLFQTVMPGLLGESALNRVVLAITDGDSNEISQLDDAIQKCIPNAVRGRCIWHILDRGMRQSRYYPAFPSRKRIDNRDFERYDRLKETVRRWMWSWAENRCETKDEFQLSKALFCAYMQQKDIGLILDPSGKA
jgi:MULE transposase domain